jgi:hypothetical protein
LLSVLSFVQAERGSMRKFLSGVVLGRLVAPILLTIVVLSGLAPVHATADPQRWERFLVREAFQSSMARHA